MAFTAFVSAGITGWEVDYTIKVIRYASGSRMTVQTLYSGLMNEWDDSTQMDDKIPMSAQTPTEFTLTNGWHIPESSMGYLSGGSIQTSGYDSGNSSNLDPIHVITMSAWTNAPVSTDIGKTVTGASGGTGTLLSYDTATKKLWVRVAQSYSTATWAGAINVTSGTAIGGTLSGTPATGEDVWANFYTLGTYPGTVVFYIYQNGSKINTYGTYSAGDLDQLIKTKSSGSTIDSGKVTIYGRESQYLYDNFTATASATGGRNPVPIGINADTNDTGAAVSGVTVVFGATTSDVNGDGTAESYDVTVDGGGTNTCLEVYRYLKQIIGRTAANPGTFSSITPNTGAGTGYFYRYANAAYTETKQAPFAQFAGGKIFGARGILITNVTDPNNRVLIDSAGVTRTPPVTVTVQVTGVQSGDRVLVARSTGAGSVSVNKSQFTITSAASGAGSITVSVGGGSVPTDIPTTGVIRVGDDPYTYTALNRGTGVFTISGTLSRTYTGADSCYVPLIDAAASGTSISGTPLQYLADINVVYRVRRYTAGAGNSILPFENSGVVKNVDISFSAVRTIDPVAT